MVRVPKKKKFLNKLQQKSSNVAQELIHGKFISIDPSSGSRSSSPGYALWEGGKLVDYGKLNIAPKDELNRRLYQIRTCLQLEFPDVQVLVIENIPPMIHGGIVNAVLSLHRAVGAIMSAFDIPMVEVAPVSWRKLLPEGYRKDDDNDAVMIGYAALREACLLTGLEEPELPSAIRNTCSE